MKLYDVIMGDIRTRLSEQQIRMLFREDTVKIIRRVDRQDGEGIVKLNEYSLKPGLI